MPTSSSRSVLSSAYAALKLDVRSSCSGVLMTGGCPYPSLEPTIGW